MTAELLNDGLYHPLYNKNGWRMRWLGTEGSKVYKEWTYNSDNEAENLTSFVQCFNTAIIRPFGEGASNYYESGRPDGAYLFTESNSTAVTIEW